MENKIDLFGQESEIGFSDEATADLGRVCSIARNKLLTELKNLIKSMTLFQNKEQQHQHTPPTTHTNETALSEIEGQTLTDAQRFQRFFALFANAEFSSIWSEDMIIFLAVLIEKGAVTLRTPEIIAHFGAGLPSRKKQMYCRQQLVALGLASAYEVPRIEVYPHDGRPAKLTKLFCATQAQVDAAILDYYNASQGDLAQARYEQRVAEAKEQAKPECREAEEALAKIITELNKGQNVSVTKLQELYSEIPENGMWSLIEDKHPKMWDLICQK